MSISNEECRPVGLRGTIQLSDGNDCFDGTQLANIEYTYNSSIVSATTFKGDGGLLSNVGGTGPQNLQEVTTNGNSTTNDIQMLSLQSNCVIFTNGSNTLSTNPGMTYNDSARILNVDSTGGADLRLLLYINKFNITVKRGQPIHIVTQGNSGNINGVLADSSDPTLMPVIGLSMEGYTSGVSGYVVRDGELIDIVNDGTVFDVVLAVGISEVGKVVYVNGGGLLTISRPTGSIELIQNIGIITRVGGSGIAILIQGSGRANDTPNRILASDANIHQSVTIGGGPIQESTNLYVTGNAYVGSNITSGGTFFADTMRGVAHGLGVGAVHYNTATKELTYSID